jgi:hypothetical protein
MSTDAIQNLLRWVRALQDTVRRHEERIAKLENEENKSDE